MAKVHVGVLRATVVIPGARSLKDRRQVVRSLVERLRSRFPVSAHELATSEHPGREDIVVTTAGNERGVVDRVLDDVRRFIENAPDSGVGSLDSETFGWHPVWERAVDRSVGGQQDLDEEEEE